MSSKDKVLKICRACRLVCDERVCGCGCVPTPYIAIAELPPNIAEELRAMFLEVNTPDGLKKRGE